MKQYSTSFWGALLLAGMSLGTAWAIRGQFGHEQGAAWAGAIGCLATILLVKRADWYPKALKATLAGAIGWGLGGLMSYGLVVGYGRGDDFPNVFYGLSMLFVIGSLYGFLGGGLFGLVLEETEEKTIAWHLLLVEMVAVAIVTYFFVIEEWGWHMTPPRSELWAACLGMAFALTWFQYRNGYHTSLRIAVLSGLGAGFGFAFGNFLQVMGTVSGLAFNFWNVMEYSLGFFGGIGMAYGTFTGTWAKGRTTLPVSGTWFPIGMLALAIPLVVWEQSFKAERLFKTLEPLSGSTAESLTQLTQWSAFILILISGFYWVYTFYAEKHSLVPSFAQLQRFFLLHFGVYMLCSYLITGALLSTYRIEQYLYLLNLLVIGYFLAKVQPDLVQVSEMNRNWMFVMVGMLAMMALLSLLAISSHDALKGAQVRF